MSKINEEFLVVLKSGIKNNYLNVDFLSIKKLFEKNLIEFRKELAKELPIKEVLKKFKRFRFLLNQYDYCEFMGSSYQGLSSNSGIKVIRYFLSRPEEELVEFFITRLKAYRIEKAYNNASLLIEKEQLLAFSHRKVGWSANPFNLSNKFRIQFNTNFGYGYVSYFYLVIQYKEVNIIPYSDWIIYLEASIYQIQHYTRKYKLANESWLLAMEDCKNIYNLSISDEEKFVEKYITEEAKKMVQGLKEIMKHNEFKLLNLDMDKITIRKQGYKIIEYRAEKISGALKFIGHLNNFDKIKDIPFIINEIEDINKELLLILKKEYDLVTARLDIIKPELLRLKPILAELWAKSTAVLKRRNGINKELHDKYKDHFSERDRSKEIDSLISKERPNWKEDMDAFFILHNSEYNSINLEAKKLHPHREIIAKYLSEIENYFKNR